MLGFLGTVIGMIRAFYDMSMAGNNINIELLSQGIYQAMITGPQNMPNFTNATLPVEKKQAIIKYIEHLQSQADPGGLALGAYGPVTEGVFIWTAGLGALLAAAVWIGAKVR